MLRKIFHLGATSSRTGTPTPEPHDALQGQLTELEAERQRIFQDSLDRWQCDFQEAEDARYTKASMRDDSYRAFTTEASARFTHAQAERSRAFDAACEKRAETTRRAVEARRREFGEQEAAHLASFQRQRDTFAERVHWHADVRLKHEKEMHRHRMVLWNDTMGSVKEALGRDIRTQDELFAQAEVARDARVEEVLKIGPPPPDKARELTVDHTDSLRIYTKSCRFESAYTQTNWQEIPGLETKARDHRQVYSNSRDRVHVEETAPPSLRPEPETHQETSCPNSSTTDVQSSGESIVIAAVQEIPVIAQPVQSQACPSQESPATPAASSAGPVHSAWQMFEESETRRDHLAKAEEDNRQRIFCAEEGKRDAALKHTKELFAAFEQRLTAVYNDMARGHDQLEKSLERLTEDEELEYDARFCRLQVHTSTLFQLSLDTSWNFAVAMCDIADQEVGILIDSGRQLQGRTAMVARSRRTDIYERAQKDRERKLGFVVYRTESEVNAAGAQQYGSKQIPIIGLEPRILLNLHAQLNEFMPVPTVAASTSPLFTFDELSLGPDVPPTGSIKRWCEEKQERREKLFAEASRRRAKEFQAKDIVRSRQFEREQADRAERLARISKEHARHFAATQLSRQLMFLEREKELSKRLAFRQQFQNGVLVDLRKTLEEEFEEAIKEMQAMWGRQESERNALFQSWLFEIWARVERQAVNAADAFLEEDRPRQRAFESLVQLYLAGGSSGHDRLPKVPRIPRKLQNNEHESDHGASCAVADADGGSKSEPEDGLKSDDDDDDWETSSEESTSH